MKLGKIIGTILLVAFTACFLWLKWKRDEPRRQSIQALQNLSAAVQFGSPAVLDRVILPPVLTGRTTAEQTEFLTKALGGEISVDGVDALQRHGNFGPLKELFPQEADVWGKMAGVDPDNCVAFKMEQNRLRAEVVLVREGASYRVVRCDNVKQMARVD